MPLFFLSRHQEAELAKHESNNLNDTLDQPSINRYVWLARKKRKLADQQAGYADVVEAATYQYVRGMRAHWLKLAATDDLVRASEAGRANRKRNREFVEENFDAGDNLTELDFAAAE